MVNVYHTCGLATSTVNYFCRLANGVGISLRNSGSVRYEIAVVPARVGLIRNCRDLYQRGETSRTFRKFAKGSRRLATLVQIPAVPYQPHARGNNGNFVTHATAIS